MWSTPPRGPLVRPLPNRLPRNHRLPPALRAWHSDHPDRSALSQDELARDPALALVEAVLMIAEEPLPPRKIATLTGLNDTNHVRRLLERLRELYDRDGTAFQVWELAGGFQLLTRPEYQAWLTRVRRPTTDVKLTAALRETLAIVAYRQPIMRANIEGIRGVHCGEALRQLMEKGLVRIVGRDESLGRPVLYGTTKKFLQLFGLRSLRDLPPLTDG